MEGINLLVSTMLRLATGTEAACGWPTADRRAVLAGLDRVLDGLGAVRAQVLVAERDSGDWQGRGDRTFEAWRGRTSTVGQRAATVQVRQAEELDVVPSVAAAVTDGLIGLEHAKVIAKLAATGTPTQRAAAQSRDGQRALVDLATRVDAGTFKHSATRSPTTDAPPNPGSAAPRASMARVWYEFRHPDGRTFGQPPDPEPGPPLETERTSTPDDLDWTRVINPITGMSQPAFMLA